MSVKQLKTELPAVVRDLTKLSLDIDKISKRIEKIEKPQKTKTVELSEFFEIDPAILARVIRGKTYQAKRTKLKSLTIPASSCLPVHHPLPGYPYQVPLRFNICRRVQ